MIPKMGKHFNLIRKINHISSSSSSNCTHSCNPSQPSKCDYDCSSSNCGAINDKYKEVMQIVKKKGPPLTPKQIQYCSEACIGRVLKSKRENVKKAAKQVRETLTWRATLDVDFLTADEFGAELALGAAYVAGEDDVGRPVVIVRLKPENWSNNNSYHHHHHHHQHAAEPPKQFVRYFVFTMEVAITCMMPGVEQCVLIFDASACGRRSSHAGISAVIQLLKVLGEHYPERLAKSFILDAPSMFYYLWKGIGKLVDMKTREKPRLVFSRNYMQRRVEGARPRARARVAALWATATPVSGPNCMDTTSEEEEEEEEEEEQQRQEQQQQLDCYLERPDAALVHAATARTLSSLMAWTPSSSPMVTATGRTSSAWTISTMRCVPPPPPPTSPRRRHARSFSFATSASINALKEESSKFRSFRADIRTPSSSRQVDSDVNNHNNHHNNDEEEEEEQPDGRTGSIGIGSSRRWADLMSFITGGARRDDTNDHRDDESQYGVDIHRGRRRDKKAMFKPYYDGFVCARQYDEAAYRGRMKPPLAGLISILSHQLRVKQPSFSFRTNDNAKIESMLYHLHFD